MATGPTTRETILQSLRGWLKIATDDPGSPLTDAQVYVQESDGPRPIGIALLSVELIAYDIATGTDERISGVDGNSDPVVSVRGQRRATATVRAFGDDATEWLAEAKASLYRDSIREFLNDEGLAISLLGSGQSDASTLLSGLWELRSTQDFDIAYTYDSVEESATEALTYEHTGTYESDVSADLVTTITINV